MPIFAQFQGGQNGALFAHGRSQNFASNRGISVTAESGGLKINTPYNAGFVSDLKNAVPATSRKWDNASKCWLVSRDYADVVKQCIDLNYSCDVVMPTVIAAAVESFETTFQADYVANCKNEAASVHSNGGWNAKIPEKVLRSWFKQADASAPATLYGLLGIDQAASAEAIKKAYKRAARQWHPDICREENAREMFEQVKSAYDTLSDPVTRNRYNAGLMFEAMSKRPGSRHSRAVHNAFTTFTPILRCGMLTVKAKRELGVLVVEEILAWEDVKNEFDQIMVSFWAGDNFSVMWV